MLQRRERQREGENNFESFATCLAAVSPIFNAQGMMIALKLTNN